MPIRQKKVLVVDDSALMRRIISDILEEAGDFVVVGTARDGRDALEKINRFKPDLVTLDVEMPRMNGLEFLKEVMKSSPLPVIMLSSLTRKGSETTVEALSLGAYDFVTKPGVLTRDMKKVKEELVLKARSTIKAKNISCNENKTCPVVTIKERKHLTPSGHSQCKTLVAMGASTGGPRAVENVLTRLPPDFPVPIIVTQHMPKGFTLALARRLDRLTKIRVKEGEMGDKIEKGLALIAPGGYHMEVDPNGKIRLTQDPPVEHVRPSINVMLSSAVKIYGGGIVGVILTGMGKDGAAAMVELKKAGGRTIVQDESTSVIFSMPKAVITQKAADIIAPLDDIARILVEEVTCGRK